MLLPPSQPQVVFSFRQAYLSQQSTFFFAKKEKCKTKQILWIFICLLKKQDACHVDKLAPSCLPWRDFNDLSNLVRNAHTIKLVVIVRKVLTPHENISMYKTHGTKKKDKKLVQKTPSMTINHCSQLVSPNLGLFLSLSLYIYIYTYNQFSLYILIF